jgi:hypothetical protein
MGFQPGTPKPPNSGRKSNVSNKITRDIREMLRASLDKAGGVAYLVRQAEANPSAYMALIGKIIPQQIDATIRRELPEMTRDELLALLDSTDRARHALPPRLPAPDATSQVIEHIDELAPTPTFTRLG